MFQVDDFGTTIELSDISDPESSSKIATLEYIAKKLYGAMDMQLKRESGQFFIDAPTALYIYFEAMNLLNKYFKQELISRKDYVE